jgi:hypothetical protein
MLTKENFMKRLLLSVIACAALSISLIGCGGGGGGGGTTPIGDVGNEDKTVGDIVTTGAFSGAYSGEFVSDPVKSFVQQWSLYATSTGSGDACTVAGHLNDILAGGIVLPLGNISGTISSTGEISATSDGTPSATISGTVNAGNINATVTFSDSTTAVLTGTKKTPSTTRFTVSFKKGTIYDKVNNLTWLMNANCYGTLDWTTALTKAETLVGNNTACGLNDGSTALSWRLPSPVEIQTLSDSGFTSAKLSNSLFFTNVPTDGWTNTLSAGSNDLAWAMTTASGIMSVNNIGTNIASMFVRTGL